ncbi:hypothetical protein EDD18DRAFT_1335336 [Armillaria luteobubalina]|uniref:Uncharacterized protein n=1 Tax=Armillaria luteobubalina TaxID=153913 RepID=A0AA39UQ62_9AGAR|nr:hypothetical protein EDD18DRAFT_1335336 [Armillaria luteobubalina]
MDAWLIRDMNANFNNRHWLYNIEFALLRESVTTVDNHRPAKRDLFIPQDNESAHLVYAYLWKHVFCQHESKAHIQHNRALWVLGYAFGLPLRILQRFRSKQDVNLSGHVLQDGTWRTEVVDTGRQSEVRSPKLPPCGPSERIYTEPSKDIHDSIDTRKRSSDNGSLSGDNLECRLRLSHSRGVIAARLPSGTVMRASPDDQVMTMVVVIRESTRSA